MSGCWDRASAPSASSGLSPPRGRWTRRGYAGRWGWTSGPTARSRWPSPRSRRFSRCAPVAGPGRCGNAAPPSMPRPTEPARIAGVILAAGASRRMGQNKMLLELEGESLVRRAAKRALGAGLSPVVVVIGHEADRLRAELKDLPLEFAVNPDYTGPTSGSLHQGLNKLGPDVNAAVIMLGDMLRVTAETYVL